MLISIKVVISLHWISCNWSDRFAGPVETKRSLLEPPIPGWTGFVPRSKVTEHGHGVRYHVMAENCYQDFKDTLDRLRHDQASKDPKYVRIKTFDGFIPLLRSVHGAYYWMVVMQLMFCYYFVSFFSNFFLFHSLGHPAWVNVRWREKERKTQEDLVKNSIWCIRCKWQERNLMSQFHLWPSPRMAKWVLWAAPGSLVA